MTTVATPEVVLDSDGLLSREDTSILGRHLSALDGLRALAVLGVFAYHLNYTWAAGGFLGVDLFFVLSGFLITSLLVEERLTKGGIGLAGFWGRRARRLLPAVLTMLVAVMAMGIVVQRFWVNGLSVPFNMAAIRNDAIATLFYVANWHDIVAKQGYFDLFNEPSPLKHTWSLAIEEQFYVFWPLLISFVVMVRGVNWRRVGLALSVAMTVVSAAWMTYLFKGGANLSRIYYGTETRLFELTVGAVLAFLLAGRRDYSAKVSSLLRWLAPVAAIILLGFWYQGGTASGVPRNKMFEGGFLFCAILAAVVIADARRTTPSPLGKVLSWRPLVLIGMISYGIYLWHWPVIVYLTGTRLGITSTTEVNILRVVVTFALSIASYFLIERPLRRANYPKPWRYIIVPVAMAAVLVWIVVAADIAKAKQVQPPPTANVLPLANGLVPGQGGIAGQVPIALGRTVSTRAPLRVALIGDSVMYSIELGINQRLRTTGEVKLFDHAFPGWGLTQIPSWPQAFASMLASQHPELVIGTWGWDNAVALKKPHQYERLLLRAVDELTTGPNAAKGVIFAQYPPIGPTLWAPNSNLGSTLGSKAGAAAFVRAAEAVQKLRPGKVMIFPVADSLLLNGAFSSWLPPSDNRSAPTHKWVRVRSVDNVHVCQPGAVDYAAAVGGDLTSLYGLTPPRGSWWTGTWVHDNRYQGLLIGCPNDHPIPGSP